MFIQEHMFIEENMVYTSTTFVPVQTWILCRTKQYLYMYKQVYTGTNHFIQVHTHDLYRHKICL